MKQRLLFVTLSIFVLLCACVTSFADDTVNITFWHGYNEDSGEADLLVNTLIPQFEAEHPNIKVTAVSVPYDSFLTKLIAAISAGSAPDLFRSDIIWVPQLAEQGALLSLDENMPDFEEYKAAVFEGPLSTNYWKGHYYGLPLDTNTKVWFSNTALFEKAGISVPTKMSELEDACKAIKAVDPNAYVFSADGFYAWNMLPFIWSFGGGITDEEVTTADGYINSPQTVAAYEFLLKLYDEGCISPLIMGDGVDNYSGFAGGLYADISDGPWAYSILNGQFPDFSFESSLFPEGDGGSIQVIGGEDINIIAQTQHKDEALEFMRFLVSRDYQITMMSVGQMPVRNDLAESEEVRNHPYFGIFLEQIATSKARTAHPNWAQIDTVITDAGQLIARKEMSAQQALDEAAAKINELIK